MTESPVSSSRSDSKTSSSTLDPEYKVKQRHLDETRTLFTDYDVVEQKKLTAFAKDAVQTVAEKGVEAEDVFFLETAKMMKESVCSGLGDKTSKWNIIVGNDFGIHADAVKGSLAFFAVGDVKFLVYRTK
ncbi:unnamed protein product [Caenorhabditis sp. 36 PRJEB53466]|nr:unnamed protein product [Caenorhabditis sp. 36 PRJEB53466]